MNKIKKCDGSLLFILFIKLWSTPQPVPLAAQDATTSKGEAAAAVFSFHLIHKKGPVKT